jgi:hypothetical protein
MNDTILAYLISLGITGVGIVWMVASGHSANSAASALCMIIGVPTIAVGLISLFGELGNRMD